MIVDSNAATPAAPELSRLPLDAKFAAPQLHPGAVSRAHLVATARSSDCPLVTVTAPAGYGKSMFLAEWAAAEDRRVAWVSLDRLDDDPSTLLVSLASAWYRAGLGGADLVADVSGPGVSVLGRAAPRLAAEFRTSLVPFVLMLDNAGQIATLRRWCRAIGDANIERYPPLAVFACWVGVLTDDTAGAERWAAFLDAASFDGAPADGSASFESARAMVRAAMCASGPEQMMADAAFAVAHEPSWSPWRAEALYQLGEAHLLAGHLDQVRRLLTEALAVAVPMGITDLMVLGESELAMLAMDRGDWNEAAGRLERALATIDENRLHDYAACLLAFPEAARLAVHRGDLTGARRQLTRGMRARPGATYAHPQVAVRLRLQLARVYFALAEVATARQLLSEIDDILRQSPALGTLTDQVEQFRRVLASSTTTEATGRSPLTPAELRLLPYLQTHLNTPGIAERLFLSRYTVKSQMYSIYRKLGVSSRNDAVQKATAIGLLGA